MKTRVFLSGLICATALIGLSAGQADSARTALERARKTAVLDGQLADAIAQFQAIVDQYAKSDRAVAAEALLALAHSYQKLEDGRARAAYERVAREFADQTAAAEARGWLATQSPGTTARGAVVEHERVWTGDEVNLWGLPSQDGRYLPFIEFASSRNATQNVGLRDLRAGQNRLLTSAKTYGEGWAASPVMSPDNEFVAYGWLTPGTGEWTVRLVRLDGSSPRDVTRPSGLGIGHLVWSPDSQRLAVVTFNQDRTTQIVFVRVSNGETTQLQWAAWNDPWLGGFSPDGRWLLFSSAPSAPASDGDRDVFVMAVDGSSVVPLVAGAGRDRNAIWTPDGRSVVFNSDRSGTDALWAIRVESGRASGPAVLIRPDIGRIQFMGFARNGTLFCRFEQEESEIYLASIDPRTLNVTSAPVRLSDRSPGMNSAPVWSPDGHSIAFLRRDRSASRSLVVRTVANGLERVLPTRLENALSTERYGFAWSRDSRSLFVRDQSAGRAALRRIDVETGRDAVVFESGWQQFWEPFAFSPKDETVFYTVVEEDPLPDSQLLRLMRRELSTGKETELLRRNTGYVSFYGLQASPDGSQLSLLERIGTNPRTIVLIPSGGGKLRELHSDHDTHPRPTTNVLFPFRSWTPDGRHLISATRDGTVWAYPTNGSEPRKLDWPLPEVGSLSPDGRQTAFAVRKTVRELRTIDNLLSALPR